MGGSWVRARAPGGNPSEARRPATESRERLCYSPETSCVRSTQVPSSVFSMSGSSSAHHEPEPSQFARSWPRRTLYEWFRGFSGGPLHHRAQKRARARTRSRNGEVRILCEAVVGVEEVVLAYGWLSAAHDRRPAVTRLSRVVRVSSFQGSPWRRALFFQTFFFSSHRCRSPITAASRRDAMRRATVRAHMSSAFARPRPPTEL